MPCITAHHNSTQLQNCTSTCRLNYFLWSDYCCCCFFIINFWKQIYHFLTDAAVVIIILCLAYVLPWYNCTGWRGVKHQVTYLLAWHTTNGWQTYAQNSKHMSRLRTPSYLFTCLAYTKWLANIYTEQQTHVQTKNINHIKMKRKNRRSKCILHKALFHPFILLLKLLHLESGCHSLRACNIGTEILS